MFENHRSLGMPDPVFGVFPLRKSHERALHESSLKIRNSQHVSPRSLQNVSNYTSHDVVPGILVQDNPLASGSNVYSPHGVFETSTMVHHHSPKNQSRLDLLVAQKQLETAHEEILKLEAELRNARFR